MCRNSHQFAKTLVLDALLAIGLAASVTVPVLAQTSGTWKKTGNMKNDRTAHAATLLQSGQVLVVGGSSSNGLLASAELYNPANGQWTVTGSMNTTGGGLLTLLQNGQVLLTAADVELYSSSTRMWTVTANLSTARYAYTQTLLPNGKVLAAGGQEKSCVTGPCPDLSSADLYDPSTGSWTPTSSMNTARSGHTATLLSNGLVLVAGGYNGTGALGSAELYNAATGQWTATGSMNTARGGQYAMLLANGQPLVFFGSNSGIALVTSTELYDPATGNWTVNGNTGATSQAGFSVTPLDTGKVLIAGGVVNVNWKHERGAQRPFGDTASERPGSGGRG